MNVRAITFTAVPLLLLAGCGAPQPDKFADGYVTTRLHPEAAAVVRQQTVDHFGSPQNLVATLELAGEKPYAIRFGHIDGEVLEPAENPAPKDHQVRVRLSGDQSLKPADLKGLALVWQTGAYRAAVYEAPKNDPKRGLKKGTEYDADFHVIGFKPSDTAGEGLLSLNFKLETPPKSGDRFLLVGHRLRSGRSLYMKHCMHCHGASGDGNGPTAKYLNPKPRDYRLGKFKFTSTLQGQKPSRHDLRRIIQNGIPGTYMPSFLLLDEKELDEIISYVRWLSMRGEFEHSLALDLGGKEFSKDGWSKLETAGEQAYQEDLQRYQKGESKTEPVRDNYGPKRELKDYLDTALNDKLASTIGYLHTSWTNAEKPSFLLVPKVKRPAPGNRDYEPSIARGRVLFLGNKAKCADCHGTTARGNGPQTTSFQKNTLPLAPSAEYPEPGLYDDWGNRIQPRNLTTGIFRGGRRPIDVYHRIRGGIKGTPMPPASLTDEETWDLVNYVLSVQHIENGTMSLPPVQTAATEQKKQ